MKLRLLLPNKKVFFNILSVTLLTSLTMGAIVFILKNPIGVLNAQTTPTSFWNVERDGSNNLNFSYTNNGTAGVVGLQLLPGGSITANTQITAKQGFTPGLAGTDSGLTGNRHYQFGYQEPGPWVSPFPDLILGYHTGIKMGANTSYGGIKFFNDHPSLAGVSQLFSVGDGDNNVRVANNLIFPNAGYGVTSPNNNASFMPNTGSYGPWKISGARGGGGSGWGGLEFAAPTTPAQDITLMVGHSSQNLSNVWTGMHQNGYGWLWYAVGHDLHAGDATPSGPAGNMYANTFYDTANAGYFLDPASISNLNGATFASGPFTNDWYRVNGATGIYWTAYGGGWSMIDSTYIRSYGNKAILVPSINDADNAGYYLDPSNGSYINTINTAGNVGIGTTTPQGKLAVAFGNGDQLIVYQPGDDALAIQTTLNSHGNDGFGGHPANRLILQPTAGVVGIKTSNPQADLHIKQSDNSQAGFGGIRLERADTGGFARIFEGSDQQLYLFTNSNSHYCVVTISASISCASDRRLKDNIKALGGSALETILQLRPSTFDWKSGGKNSAGFIAQEVEQVLPGAVTRNPDDGYYAVSDSYFTPYIVKSIQELDEKDKAKQLEIDDLKKKLQVQTDVNNSQNEQLSAIKNELDELKKEIKGVQISH